MGAWIDWSYIIWIVTVYRVQIFLICVARNRQSLPFSAFTFTLVVCFLLIRTDTAWLSSAHLVERKLSIFRFGWLFFVVVLFYMRQFDCAINVVQKFWSSSSFGFHSVCIFDVSIIFRHVAYVVVATSAFSVLVLIVKSIIVNLVIFFLLFCVCLVAIHANMDVMDTIKSFLFVVCVTWQIHIIVNVNCSRWNWLLDGKRILFATAPSLRVLLVMMLFLILNLWFHFLFNSLTFFRQLAWLRVCLFVWVFLVFKRLVHVLVRPVLGWIVYLLCSKCCSVLALLVAQLSILTTQGSIMCAFLDSLILILVVVVVFLTDPLDKHLNAFTLITRSFDHG